MPANSSFNSMDDNDIEDGGNGEASDAEGESPRRDQAPGETDLDEMVLNLTNTSHPPSAKAEHSLTKRAHDDSGTAVIMSDFVF